MKCLLILFALILSACARHQLPLNDGNRSVLVIPKHYENLSIQAWSNRYSLEITRVLDDSVRAENLDLKETVSVSNDNKPYFLVGDLPSGNYYISGIIRYRYSKWANRGTNKEAYTTTNIPFQLTKGQITLLDQVFMVSQYKDLNGNLVRISADFHDMHKSAKEFVISELMTDPMSTSWGIQSLHMELITPYALE